MCPEPVVRFPAARVLALNKTATDPLQPAGGHLEDVPAFLSLIPAACRLLYSGVCLPNLLSFGLCAMFRAPGHLVCSNAAAKRTGPHFPSWQRAPRMCRRRSRSIGCRGGRVDGHLQPPVISTKCHQLASQCTWAQPRQCVSRNNRMCYCRSIACAAGLLGCCGRICSCRVCKQSKLAAGMLAPIPPALGGRATESRFCRD